MILLDITSTWQASVIAIMSILGPFIIVFIGFIVWKKQKAAELKYGIEEIRYKNKLDAHKAIWSLLRYLSQKENEKTIVIRRGNEQGTVSYFLRQKQANEFLSLLPEIFYDQGHGIFLEKQIKKLLFEYRTQIYRFLDSERGTSDQMIKIKKEELAQQLNNIYDQLNFHLRNEVQEGVVNDL